MQLKPVDRAWPPAAPGVLQFNETEQFTGRFERPEHNPAIHNRDPVIGFATIMKPRSGLDGQTVQLPCHHHIVHYRISLAEEY